MNDIWKEFFDLYEEIGRAYCSTDDDDDDHLYDYDLSNHILHKLIKRLILLDEKQKAERKAIEESHIGYVTMDDFFGFNLPKWDPPLGASNKVCRDWIREFLNRFKSTPSLGKYI